MQEFVRVSYSTNQADAVSSDLIKGLETFGASVELQEVRRAEMVNILEWALAAGIALWVTKSFFDGMLSKLGEATGEAMVSAIKTSLRNQRNRMSDTLRVKNLNKQKNYWTKVRLHHGTMHWQVKAINSLLWKSM